MVMVKHGKPEPKWLQAISMSPDKKALRTAKPAAECVVSAAGMEKMDRRYSNQA